MHAFKTYAIRGNNEFGVAVGRFVLMPDHIHLFVRCPEGMKLGRWMHGLKFAISKTVKNDNPGLRKVWQDGFFDHLLRNNESYAEKWRYVRENPVRMGLVENPEEWRFAGEIITIDRV